MAAYYEDRFLRPRRGAVSRRTQRNLARWGRAWVPRVDPGTDSNPEVSGFHPAPGRDHVLHSLEQGVLYIATLFLEGMIGHDRVGDRFCSSLADFRSATGRYGAICSPLS